MWTDNKIGSEKTGSQGEKARYEQTKKQSQMEASRRQTVCDEKNRRALAFQKLRAQTDRG